MQALCCLVEPVSAVIQSLSSSALTDLLQELQGGEGQLAAALQNKVTHRWRTGGGSDTGLAMGAAGNALLFKYNSCLC